MGYTWAPRLVFWVQSMITPLCAYIDGKRLNVSKHRSLITSYFKAPRSPRSRMLMQFNLYTHPCWFHQAAKHPGCNLITMQREPRSVSQRRHFWKHEIVRGLPSSRLKDIIHLCLTLSLFASSLSPWYPELIWWCILQSSHWLRHLHSSCFW